MSNLHARSLRWCFTINNPEDDNDVPDRWPYRYLVWQLEEGSTGTPHLQGYVVFHESKTLAAVKTMNTRAHWEIMRGTLTENDKYCKKDEGRLAGPWIRGHRPRPGRRTDLSLVGDMILSEDSMKQIALSYPKTFMKFFQGMFALQTIVRPQERTQPTIFILHGPSGCGKSRLVHESFPTAYWKPKNKWWDGYDGEDVVILDEYYSWLPFDELLRILDRYPLLVERKGGTVRMLATVFVFTSNQNPWAWYGNMPEYRRAALFRRFKDFGQIFGWHFPGSFVQEHGPEDIPEAVEPEFAGNANPQVYLEDVQPCLLSNDNL